jgi:hypothetical protein
VPVLLRHPDDAEDQEERGGLGGDRERQLLEQRVAHRRQRRTPVPCRLAREGGEQRGERPGHQAGAQQQAEPDLGGEELGPLGTYQPGHRAVSSTWIEPGEGAANCSCPAVSWK